MRKYLAFLLPVLLLAACGGDASREDAVDTRDVDKNPPHVIAFTNHFPNVASKCDGYGHRVFVTTRTDGSVPSYPVIIDDASCR